MNEFVTSILEDRIHMGFKHNWPRMNTMPDWFTVEPPQKRVITDATTGASQVYTGRQLHDGLPVNPRAGKETVLVIRRGQPKADPKRRPVPTQDGGKPYS